jgi:hypothetical protein
LAIGLRYLAGGSYLDIADVYRVRCCGIACPVLLQLVASLLNFRLLNQR